MREGRAKMTEMKHEEAKQQRVREFSRKLRVCIAALVFAERMVRASAAKHPASNLSLARTAEHLREREDTHAEAKADDMSAVECPIMAHEPLSV